MHPVWQILKRFASAMVGRSGGGRGGKESMMLVKSTLEQFTDRLAAGTPTPGGGSAAALAGSLSASLLQMVCDLTLGREKYKQHDAAVLLIKRRSDSLRKDLLVLVDRDAEAYDAVLQARRLPKGTASEEAARREALGRANLFATETPLATAEACAALMGLAIELALKGNLNAVSDVGSAALLAYGGLRAAVMNVRVNLPSLQDEQSVSRARAKVSRLEVDAEKLREEALEAVSSRLNRP
jgi:methenyltetrahydrofolate cyclohydrolase